MCNCRYMAPEVALSTPYSCKAEVYSFAVILWEVCSRPLQVTGDRRTGAGGRGLQAQAHGQAHGQAGLDRTVSCVCKKLGKPWADGHGSRYGASTGTVCGIEFL